MKKGHSAPLSEVATASSQIQTAKADDKHMKPTMALAAGLVITALAAPSTRAALIADLRDDYLPGTSNGQTTQTVPGSTASGLPDTTGTGVWNYYSMDYNNSGVLSAGNYDGVLTLLPWGGGSYQTGISTVSANEIFDSMIPAEDELAWHGGGVPGDPFNNGKRNTVIRWTAGATVPNPVDLSGHIRLPFSGFSTKNISIFQNNVELWSYTAINGVDTSNDVSQSYNLTGISILAGDTISYVLSSGSGGRAAISAQISAIPEPSSLGMLGAAAAMLLRRRVRR